MFMDMAGRMLECTHHASLQALCVMESDAISQYAERWWCVEELRELRKTIVKKNAYVSPLEGHTDVVLSKLCAQTRVTPRNAYHLNLPEYREFLLKRREQRRPKVLYPSAPLFGELVACRTPDWNFLDLLGRDDRAGFGQTLYRLRCLDEGLMMVWDHELSDALRDTDPATRYFVLHERVRGECKKYGMCLYEIIRRKRREYGELESGSDTMLHKDVWISTEVLQLPTTLEWWGYVGNCEDQEWYDREKKSEELRLTGRVIHLSTRDNRLCVVRGNCHYCGLGNSNIYRVRFEEAKSRPYGMVVFERVCVEHYEVLEDVDDSAAFLHLDYSLQHGTVTVSEVLRTEGAPLMAGILPVTLQLSGDRMDARVALNLLHRTVGYSLNIRYLFDVYLVLEFSTWSVDEFCCCTSEEVENEKVCVYVVAPWSQIVREYTTRRYPHCVLFKASRIVELARNNAPRTDLTFEEVPRFVAVENGWCSNRGLYVGQSDKPACFKFSLHGNECDRQRKESLGVRLKWYYSHGVTGRATLRDALLATQYNAELKGLKSRKALAHAKQSLCFEKEYKFDIGHALGTQMRLVKEDLEIQKKNM